MTPATTPRRKNTPMKASDVALDEAEASLEKASKASNPPSSRPKRPRPPARLSLSGDAVLARRGDRPELALGLGLIALSRIQYFGVRALGIGYFAKFLNTPALENAAKRPWGSWTSS